MPEVVLVDMPLQVSARAARAARSSASDTDTPPPPPPTFEVGKVVFAHKGQSIPFWRPGVVLKVKAKDYYLVKFFGDLVEHDCKKSNIMNFSDYERRKKKSKGSKLFVVPEARQIFFDKCVEDARKKVQLNN